MAAGKAITVLLLGGTAEGRALATMLDAEPGLRVITSLAGRVADPVLPPGEVRIGGFGGPVGLADWLREHRVDAIVDATHPFAVGMTTSAAAASRASGVALLRLQRPGWTAGPGDRWLRVGTLALAASALGGGELGGGELGEGELGGLAERVFLTTGRQGLATFAPLDAHWFLVRTVNPAEPPVPARMLPLLDRGPYTVEGEVALMREHRIEVVVTKDSGGAMAGAKLVAARALGLPVLMVDRPPQPDVPTVAGVDEVLPWVRQVR